MSNGKNYVVFKDSTDWIGGGIYYYYYRIDDSMKVWDFVGENNPGSCDKEYLIFDLTLADSTIWTTCAPTNNPDPDNNFPCLAWTQNKYYSSLNFQTIEKTFCGASVDTISQDTAICGSFYFPLYELAKGIGLARKAAEAGNEIFITGAIIRGVQYGTVVSVESENQINDYKSNFDVYPNPFNSETILKFSLENPSDVIIKLYDILGNEAGTILNSFYDSGIYEEIFRPSDLSSGHLASGIYLVTVFTDKKINTKKIILLK